MALAICLALAAPQDQLDEKIKSLITALKSEDIESREKATRDLIALGIDALAKLEKAHADAEGEVRARLGLAVDSLRREVKFRKKAPPVRLVTVSARDRPLKDFLADIGRQAGVSCECDPAVSAFTVTIEAKDEPLLKVLDRACRTRADVSFEIAKGKIRMIPGDHPDVPTAYAGPYRARLMKIAGPTVDDSILYIRFDAQPDQDYISVSACGASPPAGFTIRPATQVPMTTWEWTSTSGLTIQLDGVPLALEKPEHLAGIFLMKRDKGGVPALDSVRVRARFRFAPDTSRAETLMAVKPRRLPVGDYEFIFRGPRMIVRRNEPLPRPWRPSLEELVDMKSFHLVDAQGKRIPLASEGLRGSFPHETMYQFLSDEDLKGDETKLEYDVYNLVDREIEFELKDVKLRN